MYIKTSPLVRQISCFQSWALNIFSASPRHPRKGCQMELSAILVSPISPLLQPPKLASGQPVWVNLPSSPNIMERGQHAPGSTGGTFLTVAQCPALVASYGLSSMLPVDEQQRLRVVKIQLPSVQ